MIRIITLLLLIFGFQKAVAQDTIQFVPEPVVKDGSYAGGDIEDLYHYVNNNFNYNNVKKEDVPERFRRRNYFIFYVVFAVSEDGKAFEFSPKEISEENSFYKEAVRVIASTRWNVATKDDVYEKQFLVIPIRANVSDF
ncbi:MAG TPA: hypothetical protein VKY32_09945 [Flavobacterium sp.]|nr:hypothetical protein [Flavobacterium sp.]